MNTRPQIALSIAREFTQAPGPRTREEGEHSAEEFLETILEPRFNEAVSENAVLTVDLDGGYGYGTSFLEEAFGGLVRMKRNVQLVLDHIDIKSGDEPYLRDDVFAYIREALTGRSKKRRC